MGMQIFVKGCTILPCQLPQSCFYKEMHQEWPELLLTGAIQQIQVIQSDRTTSKERTDCSCLPLRKASNSNSSITSSMNINARASCVVCLLNISTTDKMLPLRTHNNYWNIFVASWRQRWLCLKQLRSRPPTCKSRTCTRTRSRIWRSLLFRLAAPSVARFFVALLLFCFLIVGIHASGISIALSLLMLLGWSLMWITSLTLRVYQCGSRSINITSPQSR